MMKWKIKTGYILHVLVLVYLNVHAQHRLKFPLGSFQKNNRTIIGLGYGLRSTDSIRNVTTIGFHFELLGNGVEQLNSIAPQEIPIEKISERVYGLHLSIFGSFTNNLGISGIGVSVFPEMCKRVNGVFITWPTMCKAQTMNGIQISFLASAADKMNGIQIGIGNFVEIKSTGIEIAGGNESKEHDGIQIAFWNKASKLAGLQISLYNEALNKSGGVQIALGNRGENYRGVQIGIVNYCKELKGLQIGLVNIRGGRVLPFFNW